jgi:hypothetical protein
MYVHHSALLVKLFLILMGVHVTMEQIAVLQFAQVASVCLTVLHTQEASQINATVRIIKNANQVYAITIDVSLVAKLKD